MEIVAILKVLDVILALTEAGFTFDTAFQKVSDMIKKRKDEGADEISDEDLLSIFDNTDQKIVDARAKFEATLAEANTPDEANKT